jgi:hypothetical protein
VNLNIADKCALEEECSPLHRKIDKGCGYLDKAKTVSAKQSFAVMRGALIYNIQKIASGTAGKEKF